MKYIDVTPTWEQMLNVLLHLYTAGDDKGRAAAHDELKRMSQLADLWVQHCKDGAELVQSDKAEPIT